MSQKILPLPSTLLGLDDDVASHFTGWYPNQDQIMASILDWIMKPEPKFLCASLATGSGKCHPSGTSIRMFNSPSKEVQNVASGDLLLGPDGLSRTVLSTTNGYGPMYRIVPQTGEAWGCNDVHMLTLVHNNGTVLDVPLNEWMQWIPEEKAEYRMFRIMDGKNARITIKTEEYGHVEAVPFDAISLREDNYYGFMLDGDGRYLLRDSTVTHNSLISALAAKLSGMRSGVLTSTKGLQDQFLADFHRIGFRDIRGQNAYPCILTPEAKLRVDEGPCHSGLKCPHRDSGCIYYSELAGAGKSKFVVTNYAFWLTQSATGAAMRPGGIGNMDLLIMDEADDAFGAIESYLSTHISVADCRAAGIRLPERDRHPSTWTNWREWAHQELPAANYKERNMRQTIQQTGTLARISSEELIEHRRVRDTVRKLELVRSSLGEWVWRTTGGGRSGGGFGVLFSPVWPGRYSNLIFGRAKKVLVMSATLTPKTADLLSISEEDRVWVETESPFPAANTPTQHVKTIRVDHRATDVDMRAWVNRIDQIVERRADRKGLLLPVSYERGDYFYRNTRHRAITIMHESGGVVEAVNKWRHAAPPSLLVSPSVTRGWDFPDDECRYIIIGKVPFPDGRDPLVKARREGDPDFAGYEAMQKIVQEAGRGTRSPTDWCEDKICSL